MLKKSMDTHSNRCLVKYRPPGPPVAATSSPETAQALSEARNTATNATSEASTMRQMGIAARRVRSEVLPLRIFRGYAQRVARAASRLGVRSVRVVPGWMQLTVIP
jgi:hypothetical protein